MPVLPHYTPSPQTSALAQLSELANLFVDAHSDLPAFVSVTSAEVPDGWVGPVYAYDFVVGGGVAEATLFVLEEDVSTGRLRLCLRPWGKVVEELALAALPHRLEQVFNSNAVRQMVGWLLRTVG